MTRTILMAAALLAGFAILNIHIAQADGGKSGVRSEPSRPTVAEQVDLPALAERLKTGTHGAGLPWVTNDGSTWEAPAAGDLNPGPRTTGRKSGE